VTALRHALARPDVGPQERARVAEAMREGGVSSLGRHVAEFERAFARRLALPHAVAVSSGTAALHLSLAALGIGPGDEVIVPDLTFVATANAVAYTGARVVLADVDPASWTLDPEAVRRALTRRTRAIVAVHLYGNPPDLGALGALARRHRVALVEDAAEGLGATWRGRPAGSVGALGTFSFYGNKVLTTGEGGMVVTRSRALDARLRHLRDHGMSPRRRYYHDVLAFNYRMTALQGALGLAQLERLDGFLTRRARIAQWYRAALRDVPGVHEPVPLPAAQAVAWLYTVAVEGWTRRRRDAAIASLRRSGVDSRPVFVPMSRLPMYRRRPLPVSDDLSARGISLPTHAGLRRAEVAEIAAAFARAVASAR
jgi:perosamine synthetase